MIVYKNDFSIPASGSSSFPTANFSLIDFLIATWTKLTALDTWTTTGGRLVQTAAANNNFIVANTGDADQRVKFDIVVGLFVWDATVVLSTNASATIGVALKVSPTRLSILDQATGVEIAALEISAAEDQMYSTTLNIVGYRHGQSVYFSVFDTVRENLHVLTTERARSPLTFSTYTALRGTVCSAQQKILRVTGSPNISPVTFSCNANPFNVDYTPGFEEEFYEDFILAFPVLATVTATYVDADNHALGVNVTQTVAGDPLTLTENAGGTLLVSTIVESYRGGGVFDALQVETLHSRIDVTDAMLNLTTLRARVQEEVQDGGVTTASIDAHLNRAYSEIYFSEHWRERKFTADIILHAGVEEYGLPVGVGDIGSLRRYNGMLRYDGEKALEQIYSQELADGTPENVTMNGRTVKFSPVPSADWEGSLLRCEYYAGLTRVTSTGMIEPGGLISTTDYPNLHPALHECVAQLAVIKLLATLREDGIAPASKRSDYARAYTFARDQALGKDISPAQFRIYRR